MDEPLINCTLERKTLRDEFAMAALQGLLACSDWQPPTTEAGAGHAYEWADAMMRERAK